MCTRIRMVFGNGGHDFTAEAWEMNRVGIWYGSWEPEELYEAYGPGRPLVASDVAERLNAIVGARGSSCRISAAGVNTAKRFDDLPAGSWVFVYFNRALHFAQTIEDTLFCDPDSLRVGEEVFKYKRIHNKKSFALAELPDPFILLAPAGRANVFEVRSCEGLVEMLRDSQDAAEVRSKFRSMPLEDWLAMLGPRGWESLCTAFLILTRGYLPAGLAVGGTLKDFDIVGSLDNGKAVFAQCKNDRWKRTISEEDEEVFDGLEAAECFYFAYGGVDREIPGVTHIDGPQLVDWLEHDAKGQTYSQRLRAGR